MKKDFGPFELYEKIGVGGMASVYKGVQKSLDRSCVLKILHPHLAEDEKLVVRFEREARAAAYLKHENIVQVIDCGRYEDLPYIAMELVDGFDLKRWMEKYGPPPLEMALLILRDICRGLEHAHERRVTHRDIKPANVMLTPDGAIKIMDFGLARRGEETTTVTIAGSVLGTPAYMSPEQAAGQTVDERSDIFSTGVVGYELLGGERPFKGDSYSSVVHAIRTIEPPRLATLNPLVPDEVAEVIHRMLEKDLERRTPSVRIARRGLETVIERMGLHRGEDLLREYAREPIQVGQERREKRLAAYLDRGIQLENAEKIEEALGEFGRALHLDPKNKVAREHATLLERKRERLKREKVERAHEPAVHDVGDEATVILPPDEGKGKEREAERVRGRSLSRSDPSQRPSQRRPASVTRLRSLLGVSAGLLVLILAAGGVKLFWPNAPAPPVPGPDPPRQPDTTAIAPVPVPVASIAITTQPSGARVLLNGAARAERSDTTLHGLSPGEYLVRVEMPDYESQERRVTVGPGAETVLSFVLEPKPQARGRLDVRATPFASFYIDGKLERSNVASIRVTVKAGTHTVRAVHPAFPPKQWKGVRVEPNATVRLTHDFLAGGSGSIRVSSGGTWGFVHLDGRNTNKPTPCVLEGIAPGTHRVTVVREGFKLEGGPQTATVLPGEMVSVEFKLRPE